MPAELENININTINTFIMETTLLDITLTKELIELIAKSFTFTDIEAIGKYIFKKYSTHTLEDINESISISPLNASKRLVYECEQHNHLNVLFAFIIELDNTSLNGKTVKIKGLENLLYKLANSGIFYDFSRRKLRFYNQEKKVLKNWGSLKEGREYEITIASVDVCDNSSLVKKHKTSVMEKVYFQLWEFIRKRLEIYDGRIWMWAGDGGILAFQNKAGYSVSVACCLDILMSLPVFNLYPNKIISDQISLRIGMDAGLIKYSDDTGMIISDVINYASRLEKKATCANGLSISEDLYKNITSEMKKNFIKGEKFDGKVAYTLSYDYSKALL
ncbi:MAG: adenylate/guanylate cyclase domain-containing protein [Spirochaetes bacterium]|nr:adenylate/guanylate cyclase domain-containing protein [Spirochaetota bacterium]